MKIKKGDFLIILSFLVFAFLIFSGLTVFRSNTENVTIKEENKIVYSGNLRKNDEIKLSHNTIKIENGTVFMKCSDCKNQICVKTGKISKSGESIICLPNKVIIEVK